MEFLFKKWGEISINRHKKYSKSKQTNINSLSFILNENTEKNLNIEKNLYREKIINELKIENHVKNCTYELIDLVKKIENLPCKKQNKNTIISKGDFKSPIMLIGESPNMDDNLTFEPINGDKKEILNKMFNFIGINPEKIYSTYMFFWDMEEKIISKSDLNMTLPILYEHIEIQKPKLIISLGSTVAKTLLKLDGIMKYRGTFQEINIKNETYTVFVTYSPSYIIKMNKYKEYEEDFLSIKNFLNEKNIIL